MVFFFFFFGANIRMSFTAIDRIQTYNPHGGSVKVFNQNSSRLSLQKSQLQCRIVLVHYKLPVLTV